MPSSFLTCESSARSLVLTATTENRPFQKSAKARPSGCALESKPRAELHLTSIRRRARISVEQRASELILIPGKVGVIQNVERFPADLQPLVLGETNALAHRCVEVGQSIESQMIAAAGADLLEQRFAYR